MSTRVIRNTFKPTLDQSFKVSILAAEGMTTQDIAGAMGLSPPLIDKYFSEELKNGKNNLKLRILEALYKKAAKGNVAAQRFLASRLFDPPVPKAKKIGKKEMAKLQAASCHNESDWGDLIN